MALPGPRNIETCFYCSAFCLSINQFLMLNCRLFFSLLSLKDHQAKWILSSKVFPWEPHYVLQPVILYSEVMDQGQVHACGLAVPIRADRMMQTCHRILICQGKSIKFKPLSCLSQISATKLTFVFVMTIHFGPMKKLLVWFLWLQGWNLWMSWIF